MNIIKRISWGIIGTYYAFIVAHVVLPQLVQIDVSYAVGLIMSIILLYSSPIVVLALIIICASSYVSYKRELVKPRALLVVAIIILSIIPIRATFQFGLMFNQSKQIQNQISAIYTDEIPSSASANLYVPNNLVLGMIENDFESYFTEAKKDGTYYVNIYKIKGEKVDDFGVGVRSYLKDPQNRGLIFYPNKYIQFYGSTVGNDDQKQGYKNCISTGSIMDIPNFSLTGVTEDGVKKVYEENLGDTNLAIYQYRGSPYYKANLKKGSSCSVVDFSNVPANYTVEKIIEISKSLIPKIPGQLEAQAQAQSAPTVAAAIPQAQTPVSATQTKTKPPVAVAPAVDGIEIHGKAAKGLILNAKIRATEIIDGKTIGTAKEVEIDQSGNFSISVPKPNGVILLQVVTRNGSIEKDEVIKVDVPLPLDFKFRAAVDLVDSVAKSVEVNITAYSEAAVVLAEKNGGLFPRNINLANSGISNILGLDFLSTEIVQYNDDVRLASATVTEKKLTILNGTIASMASVDELGCGVKQTYGETINCTIAKFADQFTQTSSPQMVHLGDVGYNAMIQHMARFKAGL